jgi:hypothetical protein
MHDDKDADPVFEECMVRKSEALWASHFSEAKNEQLIKVPREWATFFMDHLLQPRTFECVKNFLSSKAAKSLCEPNKKTVPLLLPVKSLPVEVSQVAPHIKKKQHTIVLVDTEVRRSVRLREKTRGYKHHSNMCKCYHNCSEVAPFHIC